MNQISEESLNENRSRMMASFSMLYTRRSRLALTNDIRSWPEAGMQKSSEHGPQGGKNRPVPAERIRSNRRQTYPLRGSTAVVIKAGDSGGPCRDLQRIVVNARKSDGGVLGRRIGTASLRKGAVFHARAHAAVPGRPIVSFDAARLVIDPVFLVALPGELLLDRPWPRPHRRVFDGDLVVERVRPGPRPALDQVQVLARALKIGLRS